MKNVELLGCQSSDALYLVSIYLDVGEYERAENILNVYDPKELTDIEKKNYHILKDRTKKLRNQQFIIDLYEHGLSPEQIYERCESVVSEYRVPYLDMRFISNILKKCYGYSRHANNKSNIDKNEDDELEL